jgi:hypothetical protein
MHMQKTATNPTILASPIVTLQACLAKVNVLWLMSIRVPKRAMTALPVRVPWAYQMLISRRLIPSPFDSLANSLAVFWGQLPPSQGLGNLPPLLLRQAAACRCRLANTRLGNLLARLWGLSGVGSEVAPSRAAGDGTKLAASSPIHLATMITAAHVHFWHT